MSQNQRYVFGKRTEKIDWNFIDSINVDLVSRGLGFEVLQEALKSVTFANVAAEFRTDEPNAEFSGRLLKIFQISQFLIEYLLHSQDALQNQIQTLSTSLEKQNQEIMDLKKQNALWRGEMRSYLENRPNSRIYQCESCQKYFLTPTLLSEHAKRKHNPIHSENVAENRLANSIDSISKDVQKLQGQIVKVSEAINQKKDNSVLEKINTLERLTGEIAKTVQNTQKMPQNEPEELLQIEESLHTPNSGSLLQTFEHFQANRETPQLRTPPESGQSSVWSDSNT